MKGFTMDGADGAKDMKLLGAYAIAVVVVAVVVIMGIAVLNGFKATGLVDNTTVALFVTGLVTFGTFIGLIVLALIGKVIIKMFKSGL